MEKDDRKPTLEKKDENETTPTETPDDEDANSARPVGVVKPSKRDNEKPNADKDEFDETCLCFATVVTLKDISGPVEEFYVAPVKLYTPKYVIHESELVMATVNQVEVYYDGPSSRAKTLPKELVEAEPDIKRAKLADGLLEDIAEK